jgi:UDP-4-amino-4,6-dideoxy-N-acetyl-beta-L-altrosamine transaminase
MSDDHIPYSTQDIDDDDIAAVVEVLRGGFITQGSAIGRFEAAIAEYCGAAHAVALSSGTAGLHLALLGLGIGPGQTVWTSPNSFVATANVVCHVGARVDFVDIDPRTGNLCAQALENKLVEAGGRGALPSLLLPVHYAGMACDMTAIRTVCAAYGVRVVEDAAHALGSEYADGARVGSSHFGDATMFSFHPVKSITTGEGGMVTTGDAAFATRVRMLRSHGVTRDRSRFEAMAPDGDAGEWYYEQHALGLNYRMTDFQAALGISQLSRLDDFISRRRAIAARYHMLLDGLPIQLPSPSGKSAWHLYVIHVRSDVTVSRRRIFEVMRDAGIGVNVHYIPIHLQPYYRRLGFSQGDFPNCEAFYARALSLPIFPTMTNGQQERVIDVLREALGR